MNPHAKGRKAAQFVRWCTGGVTIAVPPDAPTYFDLEVKRLRLSPDAFVYSRELRTWADRNRRKHYVPEQLLRAWGLELYDCDVNVAVA